LRSGDRRIRRWRGRGQGVRERRSKRWEGRRGKDYGMLGAYNKTTL